MHDKIARDPFGGVIPGGEEAWDRFFFVKSKLIDNRGDKPVDQLIDKESPDYIGKDWESYKPPQEADTYVAPEATKDRSWLEFFGQVLDGGAAFDVRELDMKFKSGAEGRAQGAAALKAAVISGAMSKADAMAYAIKREWARPDEPAPKAAQVPPVMQ
jgi:hypothetical protein